VSRQSRSFTGVNVIERSRRVGSTVVRRLVALPFALVALAVVGAGCRHDGREMRPALPSQNGSVSTSAAPTTQVESTDDGAFFDTVDTVDSFITDGSSTTTAESSTTTSTTATSTTTSVPALGITAPWRDGAPIDPRYTCKGGNVAPALSWIAAPEGTQEIAITMIDQDAPFDHWTLTGIAPDVTSLAENQVPTGAVAALNGSGAAGYTGPCPPAGATHTYRITVHYLNHALLLASGGAAADARTAIDAATISSAQVTGTFTGT
jgi:Raf kinase inhibitor-like YbhB/YbcL family protein